MSRRHRARTPPIGALALLLAAGVCAQKSSYAELFEEDRNELSTLEKNARTFLRWMEHRGGRRITEEEMRKNYASQIGVYRDLEKKVDEEAGQVQVEAIRHWVRAVAPALDEGAAGSPGLRYDTHGPLHLVMQKASTLLGREHSDDAHPYRESKKIVAEMRRFTEAIVKYYRERDNKQEL